MVTGFLTGCTNTKSDKETIENLKTSLISENYTHARYNAFSEKAEKEGYSQIGKLFKALATAESIHARNFKNILDSLGEKTDNFVPDYIVGSTQNNLQNAIEEEIMDIDSIYPNYIKQSENTSYKNVNQMFTMILEAEKTHKNNLITIYDLLMTSAIKVNEEEVASAPSGENLPVIEDLFAKTDYYVCPLDGRIFDTVNVNEKCSLCKTPKSNFIIIN
jgi:rubrerythrin